MAIAEETCFCGMGHESLDKVVPTSSGPLRLHCTFRNPAKRHVSKIVPDLQCASEFMEVKLPEPKCSASTRRGNDALKRLQFILQSMDRHLRTTSIMTMPPSVRRALLRFMEAHCNSPKQSQPSVTTTLKKRGRTVASAETPLRPTKSTRGCGGYVAHLDIEFLRLYARTRSELVVAEADQRVLTRCRDAINARVEPTTWNDDPVAVWRIFEATLAEQGTSQNDLGLGVFVQLRAQQYLPRKYCVTSPAMSFQEALELRLRLLVARRESWESFRREWVHIMCCTRSAVQRGRSQAEAEAFADKAHKEYLDAQLARAVKDVQQNLQPRAWCSAKCGKRRAKCERKGYFVDSDARAQVIVGL